MRMDALKRLIVGWWLILVYTLTPHISPPTSYLSTDVATLEVEFAEFVPQLFFSPSL